MTRSVSFEVFSRNGTFADYLQDLIKGNFTTYISVGTSFMIAGGSAVEMEVDNVVCRFFKYFLHFAIP
jgi:hypothetical protein